MLYAINATCLCVADRVPDPPENVSYVVINSSIIINFSMPPDSTTITVKGTFADGEIKAENLTGSSAKFTNITLGTPYNFSVYAVTNEGVISEPILLANITGNFIFVC